MGRELEQSDLFEGLVVVHLKAYGLWYNMNFFRTKGKRSWLFKVQVFTILLSFIPYIFFQFLYMITQKVDLEKVIFVYLINAPSLVLLCKLYFFWYNMEDICSLFDSLREDFLSSIPEYKRSQTHEMYRQAASLCNRVFHAISAGIFLTAIIFVMVPGYETDSGRRKIFSGWYPFPYTKTPFFEVVFVYEVFLTGLGGSSYMLYECAILMPLACLCGHFDVLSYHISSLRKNNSENCDAIILLNEELKAVLRDYDKLIRYGDLLRGMYNYLITVVLAFTTFNVTAIVLHLIFEANDYMFLLKTGVFLFCQVLEMCLICLSSSMVEASSSTIHEALYWNDWYLADKKFAKTQQMMMIRASRPLTLTALKMYPVNLETLLTIFQFIYSTAAVLSKAK